MRHERGVAMLTVLAFTVIFLAISIALLTLVNQNSENVGNAYQKQRYYNVAEAGIDRGLADLDSVLPSPGSAGFLTATPPPPPSPPSSNQTPLPNVPKVPYHYSYWFNPSSTPTTTPDPLAGSFNVSSGHLVRVPGNGALIWSYTTVGLRDIAVEAIASRFTTSAAHCAICSAGNVNALGTGSVGSATPPPQCGGVALYQKICTDPTPPSPSPAPSFVPIMTAGSYNASGNCVQPCAYGDGTATPDPSKIQTNVSSSTLTSFLSSQGATDQMSDAAGWQALAASNPSLVSYVDCTTNPSNCSAPNLQTHAPTAANQVTFVNGSISLAGFDTLSYAGIFVVNGCVSLNGQSTYNGTGSGAMTLVLGSDAQCGGFAVSVAGNAFWNGGTAYAANGSIQISGTGSVKYVNFYGVAIAANTVTITGNGNFAWDSRLKPQALSFGPYAISSFAQY